MLVFSVSSWPDAQCDLRLFAARTETFPSDVGPKANIQITDEFLMGQPNGWGIFFEENAKEIPDGGLCQRHA